VPETAAIAGDWWRFGLAWGGWPELWSRASSTCLDWLLILGQRRLDRALRVYVDHYNTERPHRALGRQPPIAIQLPTPPATLQRRDRLGGLLHEYHLVAA
jgi:hypothetical protein